MPKDFTECFSKSSLLKMIKDLNIDLKDEYIKILKRNKINFGKNKDIIYGCYGITELKNIIIDNNIVENKTDLKGLKKKDLVQLIKDNNIKIKQLPTGKKVKNVLKIEDINKQREQKENESMMKEDKYTSDLNKREQLEETVNRMIMELEDVNVNKYRQERKDIKNLLEELKL